MREKITVIDDDKDLRNLLQIALRIEGYDVVSYANGSEFMEKMESVERCDLYIIDLNLGGVSGFELCEFIKSKDSAARVILISANPEVQQLSQQVKADDHIIKPFSQKEMLGRITRLFNRSST